MPYGPVNLTTEALRALQQVDHDKEEATLADAADKHPELQALALEFGRHYPVDIILEVNGTGLATHQRADSIEVRKTFEVDGPDGDGGSGVRKQFRRLGNPFGDDVVDGKIAAEVVFAYDGTRGNTFHFDADRLVRPHYTGGESNYGSYHVGSEFPTPEEVAARNDREAAYRVASDAIEERVEAAIRESGEQVHVIYSAYKMDERDVPVDDLDESPILGPVVFEQLSDWKGEEAEGYDRETWDDYRSGVADSPTWLTIAVFANRMIETTGDFHHVFLEGVMDTGRKTEDGVPIYSFSMGS